MAHRPRWSLCFAALVAFVVGLLLLAHEARSDLGPDVTFDDPVPCIDCRDASAVEGSEEDEFPDADEDADESTDALDCSDDPSQGPGSLGDDFDEDMDGVFDPCDNCPDLSNPDQANADAPGIFAPPQPVVVDFACLESLFAADLDGDGDPDLLSADHGNDEFGWYQNVDGVGSFGPRRLISGTAEGAESVFAVDLDEDGDLDLLGGNDDEIRWHENLDGEGTFGPESPRARRDPLSRST